MIKAALKSLLGRKVRLLLSTFAIVLGVAVRRRHADLLRHPQPQLHRAVRLHGRRRRGPAARLADGRAARPSAQTVPASLVDEPRAGRRGRPGRRQRQRVRRLRRRRGRQGDRRPRPAGDRRATGPTPPRPAASGWRSSRATRRRVRTRCCSTSAPPSGPATRSATRSSCSCPAGDSRLEPDAGRAGRLPRGRLAQRRHAGAVRHPERPGAVPRGAGRVQRRLGHRRGRRLAGGAQGRRRPGPARRRRGAHRRRGGRRVR